jgi:hypothetical protein
MPRTALTVVDLAANSSVTASSVSLDATDSHVFTPAHPLDEYFVLATNTTASTKTLTVKAGDSPPADAAGQGDLVVSFGAGNVTPVTKLVGPLSSSRFIQSDGTVNLDVAAAMTGTITVYRVPRTA